MQARSVGRVGEESLPCCYETPGMSDDYLVGRRDREKKRAKMLNGKKNKKKINKMSSFLVHLRMSSRKGRMLRQ